MNMPAEQEYDSVINMALTVRQQLCRAYNKPASSFASTWPTKRHEPSPYSSASPPSPQKPTRRRAASIKAHLTVFNKLRPSSRSNQPSKSVTTRTPTQCLSDSIQEDHTCSDSLASLPPMPAMTPPPTQVSRRRWTSLPSIVELPVA
eukprot:m.293212 g.293212  ORF g.293212 m.293212 type:complete len:147 (+) comp19446_c0_seq1:154-594(+)